MIYEKTKAILLDHLDIAASKITRDASITEGLGADSLDLLDILMDLEEEFEINIPEKTLGVRVGDIVDFIESKCPPAAAEQEEELRRSA